MNVDIGQVRQCLKSFDFKRLFIQELNWSHCTSRPLDLEIDGDIARISPLAELGGVVVYQVELLNTGDVPSSIVRRQIENKIKQLTHEHIIIFIDSGKSKSVWQWVRRGSGFQTATREHTYYKNQPGDSLMAKLDGIAFEISELDFDSDGNVKVIKVVERLRKAFDVEKVTKRFYDEFKKEHDAFRKFLKGIEEQEEQAWYVSIMLNRLMFIYFIQKKGFLAGDMNYLANKLRESRLRGKDQFYGKFLVRLFFEGFAKEEKERTPEAKQLLGEVPYLNGGIFQKHKLEEENPDIAIPDAAFEKIITFFDQYSWHLDYRPLKADNEINPDVLGYIFEKYINQKQMGAYYTKEDITDYICKNTIIPFLFDKLENMRYDELHPFPMKDVEPYIYDAVKTTEYLPTETEREYQARQKRYQQIKGDFAAGKIANINDLITYNLDIRKFAEDWVTSIHDPVTLRAFYFHCLSEVTVLDPTVGSGAFLFAALNILEPLYEICLDKMEELSGPKYEDFERELKRTNLHPNRQYFILKSIIVNNLFGVDVMEEAVEICKLRLFLKLVAQVDDVDKIEPLPDIDFNIRAGNTLVGYANAEEIEKATHLDLSGARKDIKNKIATADIQLKAFRQLQTGMNVPASDVTKAKSGVNASLKEIQDELDRDLAAYYGARNIKQFVKTHQPFHWFVEFYSIMKDGGFDVIIGNPPYVEYSKVRNTYTVRGYETESCGNLYPFIIERCFHLSQSIGRIGQIMPLPAINTSRMKNFQEMLQKCHRSLWVSNYDERPRNLFIGVDQRLSILIVGKHLAQKDGAQVFTTGINRWASVFRPYLFSKIHYVQLVIPPGYHTSSILKASDSIESSILGKWVQHAPISQLLADKWNHSSEFIAYRTAGGRYWKIFLDKMFDTESLSNKVAYLIPGVDPKVIVAVLSSSLFWWYYSLHYDMYNLKDYMIFGFRFDYPQGALIDKLSLLGSKLIDDLENNAENTTVQSRTRGEVHSKLYVVSKSKPIIDEIDRGLAKHYGFTEEELNFIINYDIKYRMGKDNEEEEED
jgi:hypothetical protein